jgi:hypothetical protein
MFVTEQEAQMRDVAVPSVVRGQVGDDLLKGGEPGDDELALGAAQVSFDTRAGGAAPVGVGS